MTIPHVNGARRAQGNDVGSDKRNTWVCSQLVSRQLVGSVGSWFSGQLLVVGQLVFVSGQLGLGPWGFNVA